VTKIKLASVLFAVAVVGCGQSPTPESEVPATQETSSTEAPAVAAAPPAEVAPAPAPAPVVAPAKPIVAAAPPPSGEQLQTWYAECWKQFNDKQWDAFGQCFAENATTYDASSPTPFQGRAASVEHAKGFATAFPDGKGELQLVLVQQKEIASVVLFTGKQDGPLVSPAGELPATRKKVGFLALHRIQLDDGYKVAKEWLVFDVPTMMAQLGKAKSGRKTLAKPITKEPIVAIAKGDDTEKANLAAAAKFYELFSKHDPAIYELAANDVVDTNPGMPADVKGKAAVKKMLEGYFKAFSDLTAQTDTLWAAGAYTLAVGQYKGTNDGPAPGLGIKTKTDKPVTLPFAELLEWKEGKVAKIMPFYNGLDMATQLGLVPPPGAEPAPAEKKPAPEAAAPAPRAEPTASK
jgi:predicted ester cyclase